MESTTEFVMYADHGQFFIEDKGGDPDETWDIGATYEALERDHLAIKPHGLVAQTARLYGDIPVAVEIRDAPPQLDEGEWDHIVQAGLDIPSGMLALYGPETVGTDVPTVELPPGRYRAMVFWGGLDGVLDELSLAGPDRYRVVLWPDGDSTVKVLRRGFWCCRQGKHG